MATKKTVNDGFDAWQEYAQSYTDLVVEATQRTVDSTLAFRQRLGQVVADATKKAQDLSAQEQEIWLGAAEAFQAQAQSATERIAQLYKTK